MYSVLEMPSLLNAHPSAKEFSVSVEEINRYIITFTLFT